MEMQGYVDESIGLVPVVSASPRPPVPPNTKYPRDLFPFAIVQELSARRAYVPEEDRFC
jgi:hypothetical protein